MPDSNREQLVAAAKLLRPLLDELVFVGGSVIHPFNDGNGRTARLLMNLVLIRSGYPPVAVRPQDRPTYIRALQQAQAGEGRESFDNLLYERLDATLEEYLSAVQGGARSET